LFSFFLGLTRRRDADVTADFLHEGVGNLAMTRDGGQHRAASRLERYFVERPGQDRPKIDFAHHAVTKDDP
jgi:hypothetical protein